MESIENIDSKKIKEEIGEKKIAYFHKSQSFDGFDEYGAKIAFVLYSDSCT